jgi:chromosome segregation ATPase
MKRALLIAVVLAACEIDRGAPSDELTIVVQGDRRELEQQERVLKDRQESLQMEKAQLEQKISDLARGLKAAADAEQRRRLENELRHQQELQGQISVSQTAVSAQRSEVEAKRLAIETDLHRAAQSALSAREASAAAREAKVAERESKIGFRERELAQREQELALREAQMTKGLTVAAASPVELPSRSPRDVPKPAAVEAKHRRLLGDISTRGILVSDLPPEDQPINAEIFAARKQGDFARAWDLIGELSKVVARLKVDQKFVELKMLRLQSARAAARLSDGQRGEVEKLLREVTSSYSDGKYADANKGLNRIAVILDAGAAPG